MPHVYKGVDGLQDMPLVGKGDCVELVKMFAPGLAGKSTDVWRPGQLVKDVAKLERGTAIATFINGRFPKGETGQHAAFFLAQAGAAIGVMDQWKGDAKKPRVSKRIIYPGGPVSANTSLSNNSNAFYVIELK